MSIARGSLGNQARIRQTSKSIRFHSQRTSLAWMQSQPACLEALIPRSAPTRVTRSSALQDQVLRLEQSARLAGKPFQLDEARLRLALRSAIAQAHRQFGIRSAAGKQTDLRLRLTLDLETQPGDLYIAIEPLDVPPPAAYRDGVAVITCTLERLLPQAKLTRFIARSRHIRQSLPAGVNEAVMVSAQGFLLEGLTSNFFAVLQDEIRTAERGRAGRDHPQSGAGERSPPGLAGALPAGPYF